MSSNASETASRDDIECRLYDGSVSIIAPRLSKGHMTSDKKSSPVVAKMTMKNYAEHDSLWATLPVHASIVHGAPVKLIKMLITADPSSLLTQDDNGRVPLHLAFRRGDEGIISELLSACPESFYIKDNDGKMPIQLKLVEDDDDVDDLVHHEDDNSASTPTAENSKTQGENPSLTPTFSQNEEAMTKNVILYRSDSSVDGDTNRRDDFIIASRNSVDEFNFDIRDVNNYREDYCTPFEQVTVMKQQSRKTTMTSTKKNTQAENKSCLVAELRDEIDRLQNKLTLKEHEHGEVLSRISTLEKEKKYQQARSLEYKKKFHLSQSDHETSLQKIEEYNKSIPDLHHKIKVLDDNNKMLLAREIDSNKNFTEKENSLRLKIENFEGKINKQAIEYIKVLEKIEEVIDETEILDIESAEGIPSRPTNVLDKLDFMKSVFQKIIARENDLQTKLHVADELNKSYEKHVTSLEEANKAIPQMEHTATKTVIGFTKKLASLEEDRQDALNKISFLEEENKAIAKLQQKIDSLSHELDLKAKHAVAFDKIAEEYAEKVALLERENAENTSKLENERGIALEKFSTFEKNSNEKIAQMEETERKLASLKEDHQDALNKISYLVEENKDIAKLQQKIDRLSHELDLKEKYSETFDKTAEEYAEKVALLEQVNTESAEKMVNLVNEIAEHKTTETSLKERINELQQLQEETNKHLLDHTEENKVIPDLRLEIKKLNTKLVSKEKDYITAIEKFAYFEEKNIQFWDEYNKKISSSKEMNELHLAKISALENENTSQNTRHNELIREHNDTLEKISVLEDECQALKSKVNELENNLASKDIEHILALERVSHLENNIKTEWEVQLKASNEKISALEDEISALEDENKRKTEDLEAEQRNALEKITMLENEIEELQTNYSAVNNELTALKKEEISLSNKISSLSEELELRPSVEALEEIATKLISTEQAHSKALGEINTIEDEKKEMHEKIISIEETHMNAMDEITTLEKKNKEITDKMAVLEEENKLLPELRTKICELNDNAITKEKELSRLEEELRALPSKAIIQGLAEKSSLLVKKHEESLLIIEKLEKERSVIPEMEKEVEGLKTELNERDERLFSLNEITTTLETTLDELTSKLKNIEDELMRKEEELNIEKQNNEHQETTLDELRSKLENIEDELMRKEEELKIEKLNNEHQMREHALQIEQCNQTKDAESAELNSKIQSLITKNDCLMNTVTQLKERHNKALKEFSSITKKNKTFVSSLQDKLKKNKTFVSSLQVKLSSIETERNTTLEKITSIESQTEEEKAVLKKEIETLYKRLADMETQADDIRSESVSLEKKVQESFALEFKVNELTEELSMTKGELEDVTKNINSVKKTNRKLKQTLDEVTQSHMELMQNRDIWKTRAESLKIEMERRQSSFGGEEVRRSTSKSRSKRYD